MRRTGRHEDRNAARFDAPQDRPDKDRRQRRQTDGAGASVSEIRGRIIVSFPPLQYPFRVAALRVAALRVVASNHMPYTG